MESQPLTPEKHLKLMTTTEQMIVSFSRDIDTWMYQKKYLPILQSKLKEFFEKKSEQVTTTEVNPILQTDQIFKNLNTILSFAIHLSFLYCDLGTALRHSFIAKLDYEKRYAIKHLNVIMTEGYSRIYGFENKNEKKKYEQINKSFWIKSIKPICESISQECLCRYYETGKTIIAIGTIFDKNKRNITVHYDTNVEKVYKMLLSLNLEVESQKVIKFLNLLEELINFAKEILILENKKLESQQNKFSIQMESFRNLIYELQSKVPDELKSKYDEMISKFNDGFARIENLIKL